MVGRLLREARHILSALLSSHPGGNLGANPKSISHTYYFREVAFEWELTKETIYLPLGCLQGGLVLATTSHQK
jgi:hypothetical protein